MISVIVERPPADKQGKDISDPLLSSAAQAEQLGRVNIDENFSDRFNVSGTSPISAYMEPGKMVQVTDVQKGQYMSMLKSYSSSISMSPNGDFSATTSVVVEREI